MLFSPHAIYVGNKIRRLRRHKRLPLKTLSLELKIPMSTYRAYEIGRTLMPEHLQEKLLAFYEPSDLLILLNPEPNESVNHNPFAE